MVTSNRESGYGRYDIMLEPRSKQDVAIIMEFKVRDEDDEKTLADAVKAALGQIQEKAYAQALISRGGRRIISAAMDLHFKGKGF